MRGRQRAALDGVPDEVLPLGEAGGAVGLVRNSDGNPLAGATVQPTSAGSDALIRYPHADGSVVATQTDGSGLFIIVNGSVTGEEYLATAGGLSTVGVVGTAPNVVFMLALTVE